jgi:rhodanese-related sulfurtransferase
MDQVAMRAGDVIIKQGDVGHHYYVVHSGAVEVVRDLPGRGPVRLAHLGPGETFGEEALISGLPRNATVRSTQDGFLMRLGKQDFLDLICSPLMRALDFEQARALVRHGANWLDVRFQEDFLAGSLPEAINMPLSVLRIKSSTLVAGATYIVCSDTPTMSAVGAFLLAERGIDVCYLNDRIRDHLQSPLLKIVEVPKPAPAEGPPNVVSFPARGANGAERDKSSSNERGSAMSTPDDHTPPVAAPPAGHELENTVTGRALASLIDEIDTQRKQIGAEQPMQGERNVHNVTPMQEVDPLEKTANTVRAIVDAAVDAELATTAAPVVTPVAESAFATLVREIESKLRSLVDEHARNYRERVNAEVAVRTNRIKEAAVNEIRRNAQELKRRYQQALADKETRLAERERTLQANYDKLMTLATRIGRQKSEINAQRRLLDDKLKAAADLHREVHEIGQLVSNRIDDLEVIMREAS